MVKVNGRSTKQVVSQKPKRTARKKNRQSVARPLPNNIPATPYAYARLDPFNPLARGAKVPDFDNNHSCAGDFTIDIPISTDANGNACVVFPFWPINVARVASWNPTSLRYELLGGITSIPQSGAFFSGWDECVGLRLVGAGAKIRSGLNGNNVSGKVFVNTMSIAEMRGWRDQLATGGYPVADLTGRKAVVKKQLSEMVAGQELKFSSSVLDPSAFTYLKPETDPLEPTLDLADCPNYIGMVIFIQGAPASSLAVEVSCVMHYEWIPGKSFNFLATRPEPANSALLERVNNYAEQTPRIIETLGSIAGNVFQAVKTGLSVAGTMGLIAM